MPDTIKDTPARRRLIEEMEPLERQLAELLSQAGNGIPCKPRDLSEMSFAMLRERKAYIMSRLSKGFDQEGRKEILGFACFEPPGSLEYSHS